MNLQEAEKLANELLTKYGDPSFSFGGFPRDRSFHGCCNYRDKKIYLELASTKRSCMEHVRYIILHEIVHTLLPGRGHNKTFIQKLEQIVRKDVTEYKREKR
jgi:predicted metal-dependent hydrolase